MTQPHRPCSAGLDRRGLLPVDTITASAGPGLQVRLVRPAKLASPSRAATGVAVCGEVDAVLQRTLTAQVWATADPGGVVPRPTGPADKENPR